jgi:epoxide hydrolase-like predicted phosphatase
MTIKTIFWDLGGVLVRTTDLSSRQALADQLELSIQELEAIVFAGDGWQSAQTGEISAEKHWELVGKRFELSEMEVNDFIGQFFGGDFVDRNLLQYIGNLRNKYQTAILSNAFSNLREMIVQEWQFSDCFDEIICSAEEGVMKPDPQIYRIALEKMNTLTHQAVFIDDFKVNITAARSLGIQAIHFRNPQQTISDLESILNR